MQNVSSHETPEPETYLGDGLSVSFDGHCIMLHITLTPATLELLRQFLASLDHEQPTPDPWLGTR